MTWGPREGDYIARAMRFGGKLKAKPGVGRGKAPGRIETLRYWDLKDAAKDGLDLEPLRSGLVALTSKAIREGWIKRSELR